MRSFMALLRVMFSIQNLLATLSVRKRTPRMLVDARPLSFWLPLSVGCDEKRRERERNLTRDLDDRFVVHTIEDGVHQTDMLDDEFRLFHLGIRDIDPITCRAQSVSE